MDTSAKREYAVLGTLVLVLLTSIVPALLYARREYRDGLRREELAGFKREMERINNEIDYYPAEFEAAPHVFVVTKQEGEKALAWYFRAQLENPGRETAGFDEEAGHNFYYRVVNEGEVTFFELCGGELICGAPIHTQ